MSVLAAIGLGILLGPLGGYVLLERVGARKDSVSARARLVAIAVAIPLSAIVGVVIGGNFGGALGSLIGGNESSGLRPAAISIGIFLGVATLAALTTTAVGLAAAALSRALTPKTNPKT